MRSNVLFTSPDIGIVDVWCDPGPNPPSGIEVEPEYGMSIPRAGIYVHRMADGDVMVDPSVVVLRNRGDEHMTIHPTSGGDRNTDIRFSPELVEDFLDGNGRFRSRLLFPRPGLGLAHHSLLRASRSPGARLEVEERALELLGELSDATPLAGVAPRHRGIVDDARQVLASRFRDDIDLKTISRSVGVSPFHLSRVFRRSLGTTMHAYRTQLRVHWVIESLAEGATDLGRLAVEAGFSHHSHMTRVFRARIGVTPSWVRTAIAE
jgi:AraC-like DNA-binding protein